MGLLRAGAGAVGGVLADQWREFIYCEELPVDTLAIKGKKRVSGRSSNIRGEENIISNGSIVAVNEGQCMIIVESGEVVEVCAEPGEFVYDTSSEPSIFYGSLGDGIRRSFEQIGKRFAFGGTPAKDQRVYFFNTKEILGNKYGTASPIPFRVVDTNIGLDVDIAVRCFGEYSYHLADPLMFYKNVSGNVDNAFTRDRIDSQLKSELLTALQPAFARISAMGIRYSAVPGHTAELAAVLDDELSDSWGARRGIRIAAFGVSSIAAAPEDEAMIKELQKAAVMRDPTMAAANLVAAQSDAMRTAAANEGGGGAIMGLLGLSMAGQAGGMNPQSLFTMGQQPAAAPAPPHPAPPAAPAPSQGAPGAWACTCGAQNSGKFCQECGGKRPEPTGWTCACGAQNTGRFCPECGTSQP